MIKRIGSRLRWSATVGLLAALTACSSTSSQRAAQGAAHGAAAGAVGGAFVAAIFGGNVAESAARGAAWGAGTGAVSGAIQGAAEDDARKRAQEQAAQEASIEALRAQIGDDAYAGLEALTDCKHEVALAYGKTAAGSSNHDYALAGLWLEAVVLADDGRDADAQRTLPGLVSADPEVNSEVDAQLQLNELVQAVRDIRAEYGLPRRCH